MYVISSSVAYLNKLLRKYIWTVGPDKMTRPLIEEYLSDSSKTLLEDQCLALKGVLEDLTLNIQKGTIDVKDVERTLSRVLGLVDSLGKTRKGCLVLKKEKEELEEGLRKGVKKELDALAERKTELEQTTKAGEREVELLQRELEEKRKILRDRINFIEREAGSILGKEISVTL